MPALTFLNGLPRFVPFLGIIVLTFAGILLPAPAWLLLVVVIAVLAWILALAWPRLSRARAADAGGRHRHHGRGARHPDRPARLSPRLTTILTLNENRCHEGRSPSSPPAPRRCSPSGLRRRRDAGERRRAGCRSRRAFYPLQFAAERVGGDHVQVTTLTKPGAEPHDLELTPKAVAVARRRRRSSSTSPASSRPSTRPCAPRPTDAGCRRPPAARPHARRRRGRARPRRRERAEHEEHADDGGADPHFWLDPTRLADVATALGERFARRDPANAADYRANAAALVTDLERPRRRVRAPGWRTCRTRELVTGHAAFGYLADRYGLHQEGIAGLSPDIEPDAATLRDLAAHVRGARRHDGLLRDPGLPRPRRDRRPRGRGDASPCSTRSRASPTPRPATTTSR